jgi:hypothetical protein
MTIKYLGALGLTLWGQAALATGICEPLREQIEMQIAATGATGFAVMVVDADAQVDGKVVGTCAKGTRKLVYVRGVTHGGAGTTRPAVNRRSAAPVAAPGTPADKDVITECRDGTVIQGSASCKP